MTAKRADNIHRDPEKRTDEESSSLVPMLIAGLVLVTVGYGLIMLFV